MNWEAIKKIYIRILVYGEEMEYLGNNEYILTEYYPSGSKQWEVGYKNSKCHGKTVRWFEDGKKHFDYECENGKIIQ